jgi:signal peptidase
LLPRIRAKGLLKLRGLVYFGALSFAIIYIIITVLAGFIDGLGKSPYNHSLKGILTNMFFVGSVLIGREFIRSYLVNSFTKKEIYKVFLIIALLMTFTSISFKRYIDISSFSDFVKFTAQYVGPEFSQNLFACYLVYLGGPVASITYIGTIQGFHWLSPILPDLKWITVALIGILAPMFFMMSLQTIYTTASKQLKVRDKNKESPVSWIVTSVISIGIIWFAVGVFPIYPSVIATGSMEPMIKPGDVILVKKVVDMEGINNLKTDDVIQFKRDNILITHRIMDVRNDDEEGLGFKTKGDNNSSADSEIVKPEDVKGTIVYTVPKIGWLTLLIKSDKGIDMDKIEF